MKVVFKNGDRPTGRYRSFSTQAWPSVFPGAQGKKCTNKELIEQMDLPVGDREVLASVNCKSDSNSWHGKDFSYHKEDTDLDLFIRVAVHVERENDSPTFEWVTVSRSMYPGGVLNTLAKAKAYIKDLFALIHPAEGCVRPTKEQLVEAIGALKNKGEA